MNKLKFDYHLDESLSGNLFVPNTCSTHADEFIVNEIWKIKRDRSTGIDLSHNEMY